MGEKALHDRDMLSLLDCGMQFNRTSTANFPQRTSLSCCSSLSTLKPCVTSVRPRMHKRFSFQTVFLLYRIQPHKYAKEYCQLGLLRNTTCDFFVLLSEGSQKALPLFHHTLARSRTTEVFRRLNLIAVQTIQVVILALLDANMSV